MRDLYELRSTTKQHRGSEGQNAKDVIQWLQARYGSLLHITIENPVSYPYIVLHQNEMTEAALEQLDSFFKKKPQTTLVLNMMSLPLLSNIPRSVKKVDVMNRNRTVTALGNKFLYGCIGLTALDLTALNLSDMAGRTMSVGDDFLARCSRLQSLELCDFISMGNHFLGGCVQLESLNLLMMNCTNLG